MRQSVSIVHKKAEPLHPARAARVLNPAPNAPTRQSPNTEREFTTARCVADGRDRERNLCGAPPLTLAGRGAHDRAVPDGAARKLIVGLDLKPAGAGAVRLAAWLAQTSAYEDQLVGVHVLDDTFLRGALKTHHLDEVIEAARKHAQSVIDAANAASRFSDVQILRGKSADSSLEEALRNEGAAGIVVSRNAKSEGVHLFRLGQVARRLLRSLAGPTFVVPPDYDPAANGDGPVVCSTNMSADSVEATRQAQQLAARLGRELLLVHSIPLPDDYSAHYLPKASLEETRRENQVEGEKKLAAWAQENGCGDARLAVVQGGVVEALVDLARKEQACVVVTGSRRLSTLERFLITSIGSEVAATAPCAVLVVPPRAN